MIKRYEWKVLTSDGLLKEPEDLGPHYSTESVNFYGGFESEDEAEKYLAKKVKRHKYDVPSELILIATYQPHMSEEKE